jgi:6-pyruvoyltetrahydropterin/6-carboxytetrahydropterin synthase
MKLTRRYSFEAAHQLDGLPEGHPCMRLHGHHYELEVTVEGEIDHRGMVLEYGELDELVDKVLDRYDHRYLNDFLTQPTVENIAADIFSMLPVDTTESVRVWESERSSVVYP